MSKRHIFLAKRQPKVKVVAQAYDNRRSTLAWLAAAATAAFMGIFYVYSLFFSFSRWRALTEL